MPRAYKTNYLKATEGKSLRAAVKAQCLECMGWLRKEVRTCADLGCPLYAVRPYRPPQNPSDGCYINEAVVEELEGVLCAN